MGRLDGKVAVITGTSTGQGRAAALAFSREGATVVGCSRTAANQAETVRLVEDAGYRLHSTSPLDLCDYNAVANWIDGVVSEFGGIDILYNNAGEPKFGTPGEMPLDDWHFTFQHEIDITYHTVRAAWPHLIELGSSSIVNVASISGIIGVRTLPQTAHAATKMGIIGMTRQLAAEGAPHGIRANVISPGLIETPATSHLIAMGPEGPLGQIMSLLPFGRTGRPEEVVGAALFLASDEASYVTGANIVVDGGLSVLS
jgi:meso-butanediol dehydrogenase/(S,S)-butanediol dehydrogenase/diacetyl reductase